MKLYYIMYFLSILCVTETIECSLMQKLYHQASWLVTSYRLYDKTQKLIKLNHHGTIMETSLYEFPRTITFSYECFIEAGEKKIFDEQLYFLKRSWKSWNRNLNDTWAREYSIILFNLYKIMFESKLKQIPLLSSTKKFKKYSLEQFYLYISTINEILQSLPFEAILETIDLISEAIPIFFNTYSTPSKDNWRTWIQNYWWALCLTAIPISLKIIIIFKNYNRRENTTSYIFNHASTERFF